MAITRVVLLRFVTKTNLICQVTWMKLHSMTLYIKILKRKSPTNNFYQIWKSLIKFLMLKRQFPDIGVLVDNLYFENEILDKAALNIKNTNVYIVLVNKNHWVLIFLHYI